MYAPGTIIIIILHRYTAVSLLKTDAEPSNTISSVETPNVQTRDSQAMHGHEEVDIAKPKSKPRELVMYEEVVLPNHQRTNSQDLSAGKNNYDSLEEYGEKHLSPSSKSNYHVLEECRDSSLPTLEGREELHTYETVSDCKATKIDMDAHQERQMSHFEEIHRNKIFNDKQHKEVPGSHVSASSAENQYDVIGPDPKTVSSPVQRGIIRTPLKEISVEQKCRGELQARNVTSTSSEEEVLQNDLYDKLDPPLHSSQVSFLQKDSSESDHRYQVLEEANPHHKRTHSATLSARAEINKSINVIHSSFHDLFSLPPRLESADNNSQKQLCDSPESKDNSSVALFDDPVYSPFTSTDKKSTKEQQPREANGSGSKEPRYPTEKENCIDSQLQSPVSSEEMSAKTSQERLLPQCEESAVRLFGDPLHSLDSPYKRSSKEKLNKVNITETIV